MTTLQKDLLKVIRDYPDFPSAGIVFKDICPMMANPVLFKRVIRQMCEHAYLTGAEQIVGIESRGFLFGVPLALELGLPFVPARKKGKLPGKIVSETYALEYGQDQIEMQAEPLATGRRSLIVDDVIATGGTAAAVGRLVSKAGGKVAGYAFLIELSFLAGREALRKDTPEAIVESLIVI